MIGDYDVIDEVCCVAANLVNGPTGAIIGALGGAINGEDPFSYEVFGNFPSENEIKNSGISLQVDKEFDAFDVTSITAFRNVDSLTNQDSDFTSADLIGFNENDGNIDTFTQEIRFTSNNPDSNIDWMVGGFYFDESVEFTSDFQYGADFRGYADFLSGGAFALVESIVGVPVGTSFGQEGQGPIANAGQDNTAWSIFGTLDFHLTDRLTVTAGLNYTEDEKDAFYRQTNTDAFSALDFVAIGNQILFQTAFAQTYAGFGVDATDQAAIAAFEAANPGTLAAVTAGSQAFADANHLDPAVNPLLPLQPFQFLPPFVDFPNSVEDGSSSDNSTTHTLRVAYDLTDNINVYGSWATGFKATSWNLSRDSRPFDSDFIAGSPVTNPPASPIRDAGLAVPNLTAGTRFAGPEDSEVFEIGVKGAFANFAFNLALFDQTIEGFQSNAFTGTGFALANAGEQSTKGAELDFTWSPTEALTLNFAGTFLDPVYDSFVGSASGDLSGETPSGIPDVFALGNWDSYVRADWQYSADTDFFDDPGNEALIDTVGYSREVNEVNAAAGFEKDNGLSVAVWARNLFDDTRITTAFPSVAQAGSISGYPNQPRTYGVTVRKRF